MEKLDSLFEKSLYLEDCKVMFAACTLEDVTLRWGNSYKNTMGVNVANDISWNVLKQLKIGEYHPRDEMKNLEQELWNLTMQEANVSTYAIHFNNLATLCSRMVTLEDKNTKRCIWGFPQPI